MSKKYTEVQSGGTATNQYERLDLTARKTQKLSVSRSGRLCIVFLFSSFHFTFIFLAGPSCARWTTSPYTVFLKPASLFFLSSATSNFSAGLSFGLRPCT